MSMLVKYIVGRTTLPHLNMGVLSAIPIVFVANLSSQLARQQFDGVQGRSRVRLGVAGPTVISWGATPVAADSPKPVSAKSDETGSRRRKTTRKPWASVPFNRCGFDEFPISSAEQDGTHQR